MLYQKFVRESFENIDLFVYDECSVEEDCSI
jgi:hypothetical protein